MSQKIKMNPVIKDDIQRYKKNKLAANLAILGIVFGCVYFVVLYAQVKNNDYYYKWPILIDVVYNLFFLLFVFLFSEQVKNYNRKLFWVQLPVGFMQIVRIFWLPLAGITKTVYPVLTKVTYTGRVLSAGTFIVMAVALALSGVCVIASALIGYFRTRSYEKFTKKLQTGEVSVEATLKELDEQDEKMAAQVAESAENVEEVTNA